MRVGKPNPLAGKYAGRIGWDTSKGGIREVRGLPSLGLGRSRGLERGQGRGMYFGKIHLDLGVIAV